MSDHDRGAYTPQTDAPLAFDARSPRARRPLPFALMASGAVLLVLVGAIALYYGGSSKSEGGPAGGQQVAAVKTAPPVEVAQKDAADYLEVYAAQNVPTTAAPSFAPPPETPQPRPAPSGLKVVPVETSQINAPATVPPPVPVAAPAPLPPAKPMQVATAELKPPVAAATQAPPAAPAKPMTVAVAPPPAAPTAPPAAPAALGGALVQIGAYSSNALADKGWQDIASAFPGQMSGKSKKVEPLAKDGSTLFRTSISGWADKAAAQAFCAQLKAAGRACFVKG